MSNLLSIKQVATQLGVHWKTIYNYVISGKLTAYKVGRQWRVKQSDLDNYLNGVK